MDAAYDAQAIHDDARALGHVPIIEPVKRGQWVPLDETARRRFGERNAAERVNSRLKEQRGTRTVRVAGRGQGEVSSDVWSHRHRDAGDLPAVVLSVRLRPKQ